MNQIMLLPASSSPSNFAATTACDKGGFGGMELETTMLTTTTTPFVKEEWHEFVIIYEGPPSLTTINNGRRDSDDSSSGSSRQKNRQTFCLSLPPSFNYNNNSSNKPLVSEQDLLAYSSIKIGWPDYLLCRQHRSARKQQNQQQDYYFHPTHSIYHPSTETMHHHHSIPILLSLRPKYTSIRGGKGGFGTLLRGQSKQAGAKMTVDFGACRDLSGRRLRHVNDEVKLRKWKELEEARRRLQSAAASGDGGAAASNLTEVELAALRTPSGVRNWHLSIPSWSDMASSTSSNKGRRKMDRQLEREVRGYQLREERMNTEQERKRMEKETSVLEYVRRGEKEGERVSSIAAASGVGSVKEEILAHLKKRKNMEEHGNSGDEMVGEKLPPVVILDDGGKESDLIPGDGSFLMTLSGEISSFEPPQKNHDNNIMPCALATNCIETMTSRLIRIQSQSDFATAVVLLDAVKIRDMCNKGGRGVYIEYAIQTAGLAQIGWIRGLSPGHSSSYAAFLPNSDTGDGVGDDLVSYGYDGSRGLKFHGGEEEKVYGPSSEDTKGVTGWKSGDVLGSYCKFSESSERREGDDSSTINISVEIGYTLNGLDLGIAFTVPMAGDDSFHFYPALSLNLDEVVDVNVGPEFSHKCIDGCVGASELVMCETDRGEEDGVMSSNSNEMAPSPKRPREDLSIEPSIPNDTAKTTITRQGEMDRPSKCAEDNSVFDLKECNSVDELKALGPDRLKIIMLSMGVKCG